MKSIFLLFPLFILIGCTPTVYNTYDSTSFIPNSINENFSNLRLIPQSSDNFIRLGILVGSDVSDFKNTTTNYILFAPVAYYTPNIKIDNLILPDAVPITESEATQLVSALSNIFEQWPISTSDTNGIFYKFIATPEDKRFNVSENVDYVFPSFKFYFENTAEGSAAYIYIGRQPGLHFITINSRAKLNNFYSTLSKAIVQLKILNKSK